MGGNGIKRHSRSSLISTHCRGRGKSYNRGKRMCGRRLGGSVAMYRQLRLLQLGWRRQYAGQCRRSSTEWASPVGRGGAQGTEVRSWSRLHRRPHGSGCQIRPSSSALARLRCVFNPHICTLLLNLYFPPCVHGVPVHSIPVVSRML